MGEIPKQFEFHRQVASAVPEAPERIGFAELQKRIESGQRGRVKRATTTLVALDVLAWSGSRKGRAVSQGPRELEDVLRDGLNPMPDREISTYPLLVSPVDDFIAGWHIDNGDKLDTSSAASDSDGVTVHITAAKATGDDSEHSGYTRPDITVVADLSFDTLGSWHEIHAIEVKPYWAVNRAALFETAAQAALRRCSYSWLLVWIPDETSEHFSPANRALIAKAAKDVDFLKREAESLGLGLLVARELNEDAELEKRVDAERKVMDPSAIDALLKRLESN